MKPEIRRFENLENLSEEAARFIRGYAEQTLRLREIFTMVLSGGGTPRRTYEHLAERFLQDKPLRRKIHLFWSDERCVAPNHSESNFSMAVDALISKLGLSSANIHRIPAEILPTRAGAEAYEAVLKNFFACLATGSDPEALAGSFPRFDLVLLGMGADGHTASLFPGDAALEEKSRWVLPVEAPDASPSVPRITLTLPVINNARCVLFLVAGVEKEKIVRTILEGPSPTTMKLYPAAQVRPGGRLVWFVARRQVPP